VRQASRLLLARQQLRFYFGLIGLHAIHMIIGLGVLIVMLVLVWWADSRRIAALRTLRSQGCIWHFVDTVWIFLFPLLYLVDRHT
jgi:cytochrome c oxidase subunit 3